MKAREYNQKDIDHKITDIESRELYKVTISRLRPPFLNIEYDHLSKSGILLLNDDEIPPLNKAALIKKAVRFGVHMMQFDDLEMQSFKDNILIQKQYQEFIDSLEEQEKKSGSL